MSTRARQRARTGAAGGLGSKAEFAVVLESQGAMLQWMTDLDWVWFTANCRWRPLFRMPSSAAFLAMLVLASMLTGKAQSPTDELFLPPRPTVVLFAGLPGDLASETSYRREMQDWLGWLATRSEPPRRIFVLWDCSEDTVFDAKLPVKLLPATRETFLGLGAELSGETNLFTIIWGHGGRQGKTPVFHVRGPRVTPADCQWLAEQMPRGESRWILFFRGSGRFASQLAGGHRQIISSDYEMSFNSDPVGLPLMLLAAKATPSNSFLGLADKLGGAVEDWYQSRNLARTEEPTLWRPGAEPRRLVSLTKSAALASVQESKPSIKTAPKPSSPTARTAELSDAWKGIVPVEPRQYPEDDAVLLRRRNHLTLDGRPAISSEHEDFIQILTAEGKHIGDFDLAYSPPEEELTILDCEVLRSDGELVRVGKEEIRESGGAPVDDYRTGRRKFFSMPGVGPGAILHVRYRIDWRDYPLPHLSLTWPLRGDIPIADFALEVSVPKDSAFHFVFDRWAAVEPVVRQTAHSSAYSWNFKGIPALAAEALAPPQSQPSLLISTWPDWRDFVEWYGRISKLSDELTPEVFEKAKDLARDARGDREKVRAVYNYVTGLRYVMVPLGVNSFRPHAAAHVFKNQFGDCKDKANLFNTLVRSLGFESQLVLVPRFSQAHEAVPGLAFNHAISRVIVGNDALWVDTTDDACRFGMLPPGAAGRRVLVLDGRSTNLIELPLPAAREHRFDLRADLKWTSPEQPALVSIRAKALGFPDYELRQFAGLPKKQRPHRPVIAALFRLSSGTFSLAKQNSTPASRLEDDFAWDAEGDCVGLVSTSGGRQFLSAPFWIPKEWDLALPPRTEPLLLNHGYPLTLDEEIRMALPAGAKQISLPALQDNPSEPLRWTIEWTEAEDRSVRARLHLELARGELTLAEVPTLQKQLRQFLTALAKGASFAVTMTE